MFHEYTFIYFCLYAAPRAELFFNKTAKLKSDKCSQYFTRSERSQDTKNLIASLWLFNHIPYFKFNIFQICRNPAARGCLARRNLQRLGTMKRFGDKRRAGAEEEMSSE